MSGAKPVKTIDKLMALHVALSDERLLKVDVMVLAAMIEATNKTHGYAWGSVPAFANVARITERYARQVIRKLEALGYLRVELGGRGPKSTNRYFVTVQGGTKRSPLALPKHAPKVSDKGELKRNKGELAVPKGGTRSSADTSYIPLLQETFRTHGTAASCGAPREEVRTEKSLQEETAAKLRILEATMQRRNLDEDESERWREWLEVIVECHEGHTGDPLGGWAYRLLDQLGG